LKQAKPKILYQDQIPQIRWDVSRRKCDCNIVDYSDKNGHHDEAIFCCSKLIWNGKISNWINSELGSNSKDNILRRVNFLCFYCLRIGTIYLCLSLSLSLSISVSFSFTLSHSFIHSYFLSISFLFHICLLFSFLLSLALVQYPYWSECLVLTNSLSHMSLFLSEWLTFGGHSNNS